MKRILSLLFVLCLVLNLNATAFADCEGVVYEEAPLYTGYGDGDTDDSKAIDFYADFWNPTTANEEKAAEKILAAFDDLERKVDISDCYIPTADFSAMYFGLLYANPEYFYVKLSYQYAYSFFGNTVTQVTIYYLDTYLSGDAGQPYDWDQIRADRDTFQTALETAQDAIPQGLSDLETVLFIHEYLGSNIYYDYDNLLTNTLPDMVFTTYGALVDEVAVCQGYSLALNLLCREQGVETAYITSVVDNHGWSMVKLDGQWYHVDMTYNDPVYTVKGQRLYYSVLKHGYFLISDADLNDGAHDEFAWPQDRGDESPSATETMEGIWQEQSGRMVYHEGYWYYTQGSDIVRSRIDGSAHAVVIENAGTGVRLATDGQTLLYSEYNGVYAARFDGKGKKLLYAAEDEVIRGLHYDDGLIWAETIVQSDNERMMRAVEFDGQVPPEDEPVVPPVDDPVVPPVDEPVMPPVDEPVVPPVEILFGDLDGDGQVMVSDILYVKSMIMRSRWTVAELELADLDGDETVTVADIISMKSIIMSR